MGAEVGMITLTRRRDWRTQLHLYLSAVKAEPLAYGTHDCGLGLAAAAIEAMTGVDIAAPWRGRYTSASGALKMLREDGFNGLEDLGRSLLPAVHPSLGQLGDIALIDTGDTLGAFGLVIGERILVLTETGTGTVDLLSAKLVFRVG